ncbi:MAG: sigma-70 family RNA polymerase sigma factor [bacterium]|nr:sigma-70 family RNA polymerase sigma factor [bacterium]
MEAFRDMTLVLAAASSGDRHAAEELLPLVYYELHALAAGYLRRERPDHTLQATALVHEAYLRLVDQTRVTWTERAHFLAVAATAMRRILVNHAKARSRIKRGGNRVRISLTGAPVKERPLDLVALDEALSRLSAMDAQQARIVELRFFAGMTVEQTAQVLGVSPRTVHREWVVARAWLRAEIEKGDTRDA